MKEEGRLKSSVGIIGAGIQGVCTALYLIKKGFDVINIQGLNIDNGVSFGKVTPSYWKKFALEIDEPNADAIFLSCGGIRSLDVVEEIENLIKKPVITSNQAQMWSCLRRAGIRDQISGFGKIFYKEGNIIFKKSIL